ncbi:MAG: AEC family transporter [Lachnospiraceae bacterium]|nr:AEC family transporter [Lachnospiraceae bacterium]
MDIPLLLSTLCRLYLTLLLGFVLYRTHILDDHVNRKLSALVVNATYPMMLLSTMLGQEGDRKTALFMLLYSFLLYGGLIVCGHLFVRLLRVPREKAAAFACLIVFANTGFIGAPLAQSLFGDRAFYEMTLLNFAYYFFYNTYALARFTPANEKGKGFSLSSLLTPSFLLTVLSIVLFMLGADAPALVKDTLYMTGSMTTPLSMLVLGASLAAYPFRASLSDKWTYVFSFLKLIVVPCVVFAVLRVCGAEAYVANLIVLSAALPAGSMVLMLALRLGQDDTFIGRSIFVSTLLSALTLPFIGLFLFRPLP